MPKLKVISNNKVRANRENAKKSTGPKTVSGKEKVSGNALSHGLTAEKHVIIGESIEEFNTCLLYTSPSPRDRQKSRMPSSA